MYCVKKNVDTSNPKISLQKTFGRCLASLVMILSYLEIISSLPKFRMVSLAKYVELLIYESLTGHPTISARSVHVRPCPQGPGGITGTVP